MFTRAGHSPIQPLPLLALMVFVVQVGAVAAAEVYRWTDDNGQVHFSQRPPPRDAERLDVPGGAPGPAADPEAAARRARQQRLLETYEYERGRREQQDAEAAEARERDARRCREVQRRWRLLAHPGPVYFKDADGDRDYLDDARRAAEQDRLRPLYRRYCGAAPAPP